MYPYVNTKLLPGSYRAHRCVHLYAVTNPAVRGVATVTPLSQVATLSEAGIAQSVEQRFRKPKGKLHSFPFVVCGTCIDSAYCQREVSHAHHYVC